MATQKDGKRQRKRVKVCKACKGSGQSSRGRECYPCRGTGRLHIPVAAFDHKKLRSPIKWFGGKGNLVKKILPWLTKWPHRIYVEPFGGGASMLCAKPPAAVEVYNDLDEGLVDFFRVLADEDACERFYRRVAPLPYARALYNEYRATWREQADRVERAARWFIVARWSFGGQFANSWGSAVTLSRNDMAATCSQWLSILDLLPELHARWQRVQIEQADFRVILDRYDTPETLFYCDPPYVHATRRNKRYAHEMSEEDHADFVSCVSKVQGSAVISGYAHPLYEPLESAGWHRVDIQTVCHAAGHTRATGLQGKGAALAKQARTETLWIHPSININD